METEETYDAVKSENILSLQWGTASPQPRSTGQSRQVQTRQKLKKKILNIISPN